MKLFQIAGERVARVVCFSLCALPLLLACGGRAEISGSQNDGESSHSAAGAANVSGAANATGGASAVAGTSAGTGDPDPGTVIGGGASAGAPSGTAGAPAGAAGAAGAPSTDPSVSSFAGRWALIMSEELTGVMLLQTQATLTGLGCGGGVPNMEPVVDASLCGPVSGSARRNQATFAYRFAYGDYTMTTTLSADGTRMTGRMKDAGTALAPGPNPQAAYPTAWVRLLSDSENWLASNPDSNKNDRQKYSLQLTSADAGATEYTTGAPYTLIYAPYPPHGGMTGDLGTFSYLELSGTSATDAAGTVQAGPVSITEPELAVSLILQKQAGQFTQVVATTGSGHHYTFTPTLLEQYP
ncbi:MAG TPA: hypothetical protein VGF76_27105 [Polyangiaceae bacterium]